MGFFGRRTGPVVDGSLGFHFDVPEGWTLGEAKATSSVWRTAAEDAVLIEHLPAGFVATEETIDALREDIRVCAAATHGGIVECEIVDRLGAFGISKRPAEGHGIDYVGLAQIPLARGRVSAIVVAREGSFTGMREAVVFAQMLSADGLPDDWFADPYGAPLPPVPEGERWTFASKSDARELDASFPDHPLSRVRAVLAALRGARVSPAAPDPRRRERHLMSGVRCVLPPGFLATEQGRMRDGQVYARDGFEGRRDHLSVCRQPDFPEAGRSIAGARAMLEQHFEWSGARPLATPRLEEAVIGGRRGIRGRWDAIQPMSGGERRVHLETLYLPCERDSMEVSSMFEIDAAVRAERALLDVVASLHVPEAR